MVGSDNLRLLMGIVGRFYGSGLAWTEMQPVHELIAWARMMNEVREAERGRR